ncbi:MAG: TIGR03620 family F420-dependent LLM class oxidoreductase, partial [Solirubrobacteraceae bacterium]
RAPSEYDRSRARGSPLLPSVRPLLAGSERLIVATGIVNVWQYEPEVLATEYWQLEREFPGRLLLGIGIGHPEATDIYQRPLAKMRGFLDGLDRADPPVPRDRRCLAALAPRMLELAAARSRGAHTYFVGPQHTRIARERVGGDAVIAAELACVLDADGARARATARSYAQLYLGLRNYTSNLLRSGFTDEDLTGGGSDALIDAVVPHGTPNQIAAAARAHLDAGADHVCLQTVGVQGVPDEQWAALAGALRER